LHTIWEVYERVFGKDAAKIDKIINFLGLKINEKLKVNYDYALVK
jgi:cobalamin biosynthesis protein CobD/CbiB